MQKARFNKGVKSSDCNRPKLAPRMRAISAYLKELADICGIKKTLTTHVARHTFATFALANGVSIESSFSKEVFHESSSLVFIGAMGICVRSIAPFAEDKHR